MKQETFKRIGAILTAAVLIFVFGCTKSAPVSQPVEAGQQTQSENGESAEFSGYSGVYHADGTNETVENASYATSTANENALLINNGGILTLSNADINKLGDAEGDCSDGRNAAIVAVKAGALTMNGGSVTTNGLGAYGLFISGGDASFVGDGTYLSTSGTSSAGIAAADSSAVVFSNGTIATEGENSPCLLLFGGGVTLVNMKLSSKSAPLVYAPNGDSRLMLDGTALAAAPAIDESATLWLELKNKSSLIGTFGESLPARASVSLDATSTWTLDTDAYVTVFLNADTKNTNIVSNGYTIYYDSNAPENEPLGSQSYPLPGGGYLSPLI
ncbi:MAG: hypothetical protein ABFC73_04910 [Clostridiaceae bacterium]